MGTGIFLKPVEVDLAHCLRTQSIDGNPLAVIARLHHFQTKQKKMSWLIKQFLLSYKSRSVHIFPDFTIRGDDGSSGGLKEAQTKVKLCFPGLAVGHFDSQKVFSTPKEDTALAETVS